MEKYKLGDWVFDNELHIYRQIESVAIVNVSYVPLKAVLGLKKAFEKVIEPWKIMLLNLGREAPYFKPGDVIVTYQDAYVARYHDHDEIVLLFEENLVIRFCPEEHSIEV